MEYKCPHEAQPYGYGKIQWGCLQDPHAQGLDTAQSKPTHSPPGAMGPGPGPCTAAAICPGAGTPPCIGGCIRGGAPFTCMPPCPEKKPGLSKACQPSWETWAGNATAPQHGTCAPMALTMGCGWDDGVFCGFIWALGPGPGPGPGTACWFPGIRGGTLV